MPDLTDVATVLYGEQSGAFVAARTAAVRAARATGDRELAREVGALRRPSAAAAAVNLLVRDRPEDVGRLLDLGVRLREAQAALAGSDLRALHAEQQRAVAEVARAAVELLAMRGGAAGPAVRGQVEGTLRAAMGDADAAAALATGLLTRDLYSSGLEPADVDGAVAVPDAPPLPGVPARRTPLRAVRDAPEPTDPPAPPAAAPGRRRGRIITVDEPDGPVRAVPTPARGRGRVVTSDGPDAARGAHAARTAREAQARAQEDQERERRRDAARRSADEDVALAREDVEVTTAAREAAGTRLAAAEARAAELAEVAARTQAEIDRLRAVLADARQETRAVGLEVRHARAALTSAARAAEQARARSREAERVREGLGPPSGRGSGV